MLGAFLLLLAQMRSPMPGWLGLMVQFDPNCIRVEDVHRRGPLGGRMGLVGDCVQEVNGVRVADAEDWSRAFPEPFLASQRVTFRFQRAGLVKAEVARKTDALEADFCRQRRPVHREVRVEVMDSSSTDAFVLAPGTTLETFLHAHGLPSRVIVDWPPSCREGSYGPREDPAPLLSAVLQPGTRIRVAPAPAASHRRLITTEGVVRGTSSQLEPSRAAPQQEDAAWAPVTY